MAAARAYALTSWKETFAVAYFEAAAAGAPLVWCTNSGNAEVFVHRQHGLAVEPHDVASTATALEFLLSHPDEAAAMGRTAQQLVRTGFTWDAVARRALELFTGVVKSGAVREA
jgi:phosphatidylinositol alpha-1,6-mannosyltransferase